MAIVKQEPILGGAAHQCYRFAVKMHARHQDNNFGLIRLYAATNVVMVHMVDHLDMSAAWLWPVIKLFPGVPIFFIISGFLVTDSFLRTPRIVDFAWKRALRIYPALIVNILVLEALLFLTGASTFERPLAYLRFLLIYLTSACEYLGYAIFGYYRVIDTGAFFPRYPSGVLWTLSVELSFYVLLAIALAVLVRRAAMGLAILIILGGTSLTFALTVNFEPVWYFDQFAIPYFWIFGLGVAVRLFWAKVIRAFQGKAFIWLLGYLIFSLFVDTTVSIDIKSLTPVGAIRMALLTGAVFSSAYTLRGLSTRTIGELDLSYGLYLWHMLVITTLMAMGISGSVWLWPLVGIVSLALAAASWFLVERPVRRWKSPPWRITRKDHRVPPPEPSAS